MVFEQIVVDVLNRILGDYTVNLDASQLSLGIWGGNAVLKDLRLKDNVLDNFGLPFKVAAGKLGTLTLKIPWTNIYNSPVIIDIKDLLVIIMPSHAVVYDEKMEEKYKEEWKKKEIERLTAEIKAKEAAKNKVQNLEETDTFVEKLVAQIIKNVQIKIEDIHIRYEDEVTKPEAPFSFGIILQSFRVHTTDSNWNPRLVGEKEKILTNYKMAALNGLSFYWNSNIPTLIHKDVNTVAIYDFMRKLIQNDEDVVHVVGPISLEAKVRLTTNPEKGPHPFSLPKALIEIVMKELLFGMTSVQFQNMMELFDAIDMMFRAKTYRKYRPDIHTYKENYKAWWKYAFTCIMEEEIKRRRRNWSWENIKKHRNLKKDYQDAYYKKLRLNPKTPNPELEAKLEKLEKELEVPIIMLIRQQVEFKVKIEKPSPDQEPKGWFSGWFSRPPAEAQKPGDLVTEFHNAYTDEERAKLYKAINYDEKDEKIEYPPDFAAYKFVLVLNKIRLVIKDDSHPELHHNKVIKLTLKDVSTEICQRPQVKDNTNQVLLDVNANMESLHLSMKSDKRRFVETMFGQLMVSYRQKALMKTVEAELRKLRILNLDEATIYREVINVTEDRVVNLLINIYSDATKGNNYFDMEKHDLFISVETGSPKIFYLSSFVYQIVDFVDSFLPSFMDKKTVLEAGFAAAEVAKSNVQEAYSKITRVALDIKLKAPKVIVPKNAKSQHALLLDFGSLDCQNTFKKGKYKDVSGHILIEEIKLNLTNMQMSRIIVDKADQSTIVEILLVEPITFKMSIDRNLSYDWFNDIADLLIHGHLESAIIRFSSEDYKILMDCIMDNVALSPVPPDVKLEDLETELTSSQGKEQDNKQLVRKISKKEKSKDKKSSSTVQNIATFQDSISKASYKSKVYPETKGKKSKTTIVPKKVYDWLKINLYFGKLSIMLYEGSTNMEKQSGLIVHNEANALADFSIRKSKLILSLKTNSDMLCNVKVTDIILLDSREGERAIISLIQKRSDENIIHTGYIIDFTYEYDANSVDSGYYVNIQTTSLTIVLCIEYLLQVAHFFISQPEKSESQNLAGKSLERMQAERAIEKSGGMSPRPNLDSPRGNQTTRNIEEPEEDFKPLTIFFNMAETELILVETTKRYDTLALLMNCSINTKTVMSKTRTALMGTVGNLKISSCKYDPGIRDESLAEIMSPTSVTVIMNITDEVGTFVDINLTNIFIRMTAGTLDLMLRVFASVFAKVEEGEHSEDVNGVDYSNLWSEMELDDERRERLWFLRPDSLIELAEEALNIEDKPKFGMPLAANKKEKLVVETGCIIITLETGKGLNTVPMLLLESEITLQALGWSTHPKLFGRLRLEAAYFNARHGMWEYIIEPVENRNQGKIAHVPWELQFEYSATPKKVDRQNQSISGSLYSIDSYTSTSQSDPIQETSVVASLHSEDNLEMTITKTSMEVFGILAEEFQNSVKSLVSSRVVSTSPYTIFNDSGSEMEIILKGSPFILIRNGEFYEEATLHQGTSVNLSLREQFDLTKHRSSILREQESYKERMLHVMIKEYQFDTKIPVGRAEKRYYNLKTKRSEWGLPYGLVCDISVKDATKIVTFRGIVQVQNDLKISVDVYYLDEDGENIKLAGTVKKQSKLNLPLSCIYSKSSELFFSPKGFGASTLPFVWTCLLRDLEGTAFLTCKSKQENLEDFNMKVVGRVKQVYFESSYKKTIASQIVYINLKPPLIINNLLPCSLGYFLDTNIHAVHLAQKGETVHVTKMQMGREGVSMNLLIPEYEHESWVSRININKDSEELSACLFESEGKTKRSMYLGIHKEANEDMLIFHVYCPFWMINRTGLNLAYKGDDGPEVVEHARGEGPKMFAFKGKAFFAKKKAMVRVASVSDWSEKFSMDVAGSGGTLACKSPKSKYEIGMEIKLTKWGLTKLVIFTPRYYLINQCPFNITIYEKEYPEHLITLAKNKCVSFWPRSTHAHLIAFVEGTNEETHPFNYDLAHNTLLLLFNKYGGIHVDIHSSELFTKLTLSQYVPGQAPVLAINDTEETVIEFTEKGVEGTRILLPRTCQLLAWNNPSGEKVMNWTSASSSKKTNYTEKFLSDGFGFYTWSKSHRDEKEYFWVSFLDGVQRIILFTGDLELATFLHSSREMEQSNLELIVNLAGIGLSLVDNDKCREILYLRISSSNIEWEGKKGGKGKRYKPLKQEQMQGVELAYKNYLNEKALSKNVKARKTLDCGVEIDFELNKIYQPYEGEVRRVFQTGIWSHYKLFPHSAYYHAKLNRLQIDNQLSDCIFRIVLTPIAPPKSFSHDEMQKPFAELSVLQRYTAHSSVVQYKYFKVLVQEFHVRTDIIFINALVDLFSSSTEKKLEYIVDEFHKDYQEYSTDLNVYFSRQIASQGIKSFYDFLHFSPLKMHVSFSMGGGTQLNNNFLNLLLQSFGVTITEIEDVIFKLACLELQHKFLSSEQIYNEAYDHYSSQLIKQLYVLVLGLDVIGNPYGLVMGVTEGVQAFFYEPFHGAIQGPGEFAEGFALGVKTLVGHTLGGTAGALGRITGTMGKGVAALTMDSEYQKKRRENISKKPHDVTEVIARSGKGLFMGFFDGVTGVVRNPIKGAQKDGVEGFFKGVGKGAIGLVARPVGGLIDFTSGGLEAVKRATALNEEVTRMRLPRYLPPDSTIRPYVNHEAEGINLLIDLEKGKYMNSDHYVAHAVINPHGHFVILVTNKRVFYLRKHEVFGSWDVAWSHTWEELDGPPLLVEKGIAFKLQGSEKGSSMFSRAKKDIFVPFHIPEVCNWILGHIEKCYNRAVGSSIPGP